MVQVCGCDDSQLFAIFSVIFITFWSSQGNLSNKKAGKLKKMQRFKMCHDLLKRAKIPQNKMHCFDIEENVTRFGETLIHFLCTQGKNVSRFT